MFSVRRRTVPASAVAALLARERPAPLHRPQLQPAAVGALVPAHLPDLHAVDRPVLLPHGLDGEGRAAAAAAGELAGLRDKKKKSRDKRNASPACFCVGDHHQLHSWNPGGHHGNHFSGSWNQRS